MHVEATVRFEPMLNRWVLMRNAPSDSTLRRSSRSFNDQRDFIRRKSRFTASSRRILESRHSVSHQSALTTYRPLPYCIQAFLLPLFRTSPPVEAG